MPEVSAGITVPIDSDEAEDGGIVQIPDEGDLVTGAGLGVDELEELDEPDTSEEIWSVCEISFPSSEASVEPVLTAGALVTGAGLGVLSSEDSEEVDEAVFVPGSDESADPDEATAPELEEDVPGAGVDGDDVVLGAFVTGGGLHVVSEESDVLAEVEAAVADPEDDASELVCDFDEVLDEGIVVVGMVVGASVCGVLVTGGGLNVVSSEEAEVESTDSDDDELGKSENPVEDAELSDPDDSGGIGLVVVGSRGMGEGLDGVGSGVGANVAGTGVEVVGVTAVGTGAEGSSSDPDVDIDVGTSVVGVQVVGAFVGP